MQEIPLEKLYSEREAASLLNIPHSTLKRIRRAGRITHYRYGERAVVYSSRHLSNYSSHRRSK